MLKEVDLDRNLPTEEYRKRLPILQERLYEVQIACWQAGIPSIFVFEGWDAAGKGTCISTLTEKLDPRGFRLHAVLAPRSDLKQLPWLYRFWLRIPGYGRLGIFDRSWYRRVLDGRVGKEVSKEEWRKAYNDIVDFERTLADDGYIIRKFFFHIAKKEQKRRFRTLEKDPLTAWQVQDAEWERHRQYGKYQTAAEEMLERTDSEWGPWTIVEATDKHWARVKVFETITGALEDALKKRKAAKK